ncbi:MAG: hypothetical protein ACKPKO_07180, partial [Candidatus Fonsibacter sp.]
MDCVIHEAGEVTCDKGFRFALAGVCKYQVLQGNAHCLHQSANAQQVPGTQVPHYGMLQDAVGERIICPAMRHAHLERLPRAGRNHLGYSLHK